MVEAYSITPAEPSPYIAKTVGELAAHLELYGDIPEIDVYQCQEAVHTVALDVAERIFQPNTDARALIGEYFTGKEVQQPTPERAREATKVINLPVRIEHDGKATTYVDGRMKAANALQ